MNGRPSISLLLAMMFAISPTVNADDAKGAPQKTGVTARELYEQLVPDTANKEVTVLDVRYEASAINRRHFHPAAVTFYILSGSPVFQEQDKQPITLRPGDSFLVPAGTTHSHWNPSKTEGVRWLEF